MTSAGSLPRGSVRSLSAALEATAATGAGRLVFHLLDGQATLTSADLAEAARTGAGTLLSLGVAPGDAVGVLGPNHPTWIRWAFSIWKAGAVLVPIPFPLRVRDREAAAAQIESVVRTARCRLVLADPRLLPLVPAGMGWDWGLPVGRHRRGPEREVGKDDPAVIQFTSGSTGSPKGAILTHGAVLASIRAMASHFDLRAGSTVGVAWYPYFHDMGLVGYSVSPMVLGVDTHTLPTQRFVRDPSQWLRLVGQVGATITSGPSSAWSAALRMAERRPEGIDLSTLRIAMLSAETIDPEVLDRLRETGGRLGLAPGAVNGTYGMAETTLAVTGTSPGEGVRIDRVDLDELVGSGLAVSPRNGPVKRVPSCGRPVPGMEVRVKGARGSLPERHVGEVLVRGPSLIRGYLGARSPDAIEDGWLRTGDLGYLADGELFLTGRAKELVIVLGHNYHPQDFEWAAMRVPGVRPGRCVAFSPPEGAEGDVVLAVEPSADADLAALPALVRRGVTDALGLSPTEVLVLALSSIPKTTSGKLQRVALKESYARGELSILSRWATSRAQ